MKEAWHLRTTVLPGGRVEVADPELPAGAAVDVFVSPSGSSSGRRSALEILAEAPGQRSFRTAAEVDEHIAAERAAWDR